MVFWLIEQTLDILLTNLKIASSFAPPRVLAGAVQAIQITWLDPVAGSIDLH